MPKYAPTIDIWALDEAQRSSLQPGQWVTTGTDGPKGRFLGAGRGTEVVAWLGNARASKDYRGYMATLRDYARSLSPRTH